MSVRILLQEAVLGKLTKLGALQTIIGIDNIEAAKACLVSKETYRRWRSDRKPNKTAVKLLGILAGYFPWPGWEKFFYNPHDQRIYSTELKHGFCPGDLHALQYLRQTNEVLERENAHLRERLKDLENMEAPEASIVENPNILPFPRLREALRSRRVDSEHQLDPKPSRKAPRSTSGIVGFIRRMTG